MSVNSVKLHVRETLEFSDEKPSWSVKQATGTRPRGTGFPGLETAVPGRRNFPEPPAGSGIVPAPGKCRTT